MMEQVEERVYLGKIASVVDHGSIVQMWVIFDDGEAERYGRSFAIVNWDWRMFKNFAEGRDGLVELEVEIVETDEGEYVRVPGEDDGCCD